MDKHLAVVLNNPCPIPSQGDFFHLNFFKEMNQMVEDNKNKNNSSNSLVFGRWPQTKISIVASLQGTCLKIRYLFNRWRKSPTPSGIQTHNLCFMRCVLCHKKLDIRFKQVLQQLYKGPVQKSQLPQGLNPQPRVHKVCTLPQFYLHSRSNKLSPILTFKLKLQDEQT